jgi:hypothetical protein
MGVATPMMAYSFEDAPQLAAGFFTKNERIGLMIPAAIGPVMRSVVRMMMRGSWSEGLLRFSRQVSHAAPAM